MGAGGFGVGVGEAGVGEEEKDGLVDEGVFAHGDFANAARDGHRDFSEVVEETNEPLTLMVEFHYVELLGSLTGY